MESRSLHVDFGTRLNRETNVQKRVMMVNFSII